MAQAEPVFDVPTLSARLKRGVIGGGEDRARQRCDEVARDGDAIAFAPPITLRSRFAELGVIRRTEFDNEHKFVVAVVVARRRVFLAAFAAIARGVARRGRFRRGRFGGRAAALLLLFVRKRTKHGQNIPREVADVDERLVFAVIDRRIEREVDLLVGFFQLFKLRVEFGETRCVVILCAVILFVQVLRAGREILDHALRINDQVVDVADVLLSLLLGEVVGSEVDWDLLAHRRFEGDLRRFDVLFDELVDRFLERFFAFGDDAVGIFVDQGGDRLVQIGGDRIRNPPGTLRTSGSLSDRSGRRCWRESYRFPPRCADRAGRYSFRRSRPPIAPRCGRLCGNSPTDGPAP